MFRASRLEVGKTCGAQMASHRHASVPRRAACPTWAPLSGGREGETPPNSMKRETHHPRPGPQRKAHRDRDPGGRRAGATSARPSQPAAQAAERRERG